ncbi:zinc finger protein 236-like [Cololabis saira]|uniref:zinc finger protein 236-like n=1 Tax=Cololabis saira TaxID=129043 RepID=UPI002AD49B89|nr:zinc finger protein 236-like [Cololabis saira]
MAQMDKMRVFVSQRLNAAVEEILAMFAGTLMKYEQEAAQCHEVMSRQHALLCALNRPVMDSPYADMFTKQMLLNEEAAPLDLQDQNQNPPQDTVPEPPQAGEEPAEEQLQDLEAEIIEFTFNSKLATKPSQNRQLSTQNRQLSTQNRQLSTQNHTQNRQRSDEPGPPRARQDVSLVLSSDTEDSSDYNNDPIEMDSTKDKPQELSKPDGFSCLACSRTFSARRFLSRHVGAHLRDKQHVCGLCGERFERSDGLALHLRTHRRTNTLQIQARTLNREKRLQRSSGLQVHVQVKGRQEPNKCGNCGKALLKGRHKCLPQKNSKDINLEKPRKKRRRMI